MINPRLGLSVVRMALSFILAGQIYSPARTGAPQIVENPETPKYSENEAPELVFKREISVPLAGRRFSFDVDDSGNIYLLESLAGQISVYDKNGQLITQFGKKGQGPGEFENPFFLSVSNDNKIFVIDRPRKAFQIFNLQGKWLEQRRFPSLGMMNSLKIDSQGSLYIQDMRNLFALKDEERIRRGVAGLSRLSKFNRAFEKISEIAVWDNVFLKRSPGAGYDLVLYHDIFYYQIAKGNTLYYGNSLTYEIRQLTSDGLLKKIIRKKTNRIATTKQDWINMMRDFPEWKEQNPEISKTKPFFFDFHVLDKIGLLVGTYEDEWNDQETLVCDLFDQDGVYIAKVRIPRYYYAKDQDTLSEQRHRVFKNGRCYSIVYNEKDEALELVRHSVELKWPLGKSNRAIFLKE